MIRRCLFFARAAAPCSCSVCFIFLLYSLLHLQNGPMRDTKTTTNSLFLLFSTEYKLWWYYVGFFCPRSPNSQCAILCFRTLFVCGAHTFFGNSSCAATVAVVVIVVVNVQCNGFLRFDIFSILSVELLSERTNADNWPKCRTNKCTLKFSEDMFLPCMK